jgi:hypothetical protein
MSSALVECSRLTVRRRNTRVKIVRLATSAHVPDTEFTVLPVMAIRFGPTLTKTTPRRLDKPSSCRFGCSLRRARQQPRCATSTSRCRATTAPADEPSTSSEPATMDSRCCCSTPYHGGFVSLRASTTDSAGKSVRQTILDAYRLRP